VPQERQDTNLRSSKARAIDELENWFLSAFEESTWNSRTYENEACTMTQPKPSLTPQTPLKSWCHSLESTSLLGCLGKMESVPVEERMSLQMECQLLDADPTTAQRLIRKSGGPFDIGIIYFLFRFRHRDCMKSA